MTAVRGMHRWLRRGGLLLLGSQLSLGTFLKTSDQTHLRQPLESGDLHSREVKALYALDAIYKGKSNVAGETNSTEEQAHRDVYNASGDPSASVYGEILPEAVLEMFRITGAHEGQRYYDLGSGYGKTVVLGWLMGLNATGVELADNRWGASCNALRRAPEVGVSGSGNGVNFLHASFLDVDFADADLVFMDSVMFSEETMRALAEQAKHLRPEAKIVSSHFGLPGPGFKELGQLKGAVSWSNRKSRWTIQSVRPEAHKRATSNSGSHAGHSSQMCTI